MFKESSMAKYTVVIAGSTSHTRLCAESLRNNPDFEIVSVVTPLPKPVGRKQEITPNPLHQFAVDHEIPVVLVDKKIDLQVRKELESELESRTQAASSPQDKTDQTHPEKKPPAVTRPDFLLVVDFGYFVPNWLLAFPKTAPINIHPSSLPKWRGSSPGQFVLLYGESESSVSVIVMNDLLDQGDIVTQLPFAVDPNWTQTEYYNAGFALVAAELPEILKKLAQGQITPQPQPLDSPTPTASRFTKQDGFVPWELVKAAMEGKEVDTVSVVRTFIGTTSDRESSENVANASLSPILAAALNSHTSVASFTFHATKALAPWPGVWTVIPTESGEQRMKILSTVLENEVLRLDRVQVAGKQAAQWQEVKNIIK